MAIEPGLPVEENRRQAGWELSPGITYWEVLSHPQTKDSPGIGE